MYRKFSVLFLLGLLSQAVMAAPQTFSSGPNRVATVELYTSEGCSSCPPAEQYLTSLRKSPGLWKDFIPMAFHVDYWDYLGWRDRFSSALFSQRQRQYARLLRMNTVYTPGFFVDGREWRRGLLRGKPAFRHENVGRLNIYVQNQQLTGEFEPTIPGSRKLRVNVALLGMGLQSKINSGERGGTSTTHDFVVLGYTQQPLPDSSFSVALPKPSVAAKEKGIVVWVSQDTDPTPLQAVGGLLKPSE